jgi:succinate dehydrogenase / fumarate reductase cytochrome b subunit
MGLDRKVGFTAGLKYQGGGPMLAWILHRISGLGMLFFVGLHVLASFFTQQFGSDWAIAVNTIYESFWFQIFVIFFVLFHALNGLRIIILDLRPELLQYQREAIWLQWAVFIPLYGLTVFLIIQLGLSGG